MPTRVIAAIPNSIVLARSTQAKTGVLIEASGLFPALAPGAVRFGYSLRLARPSPGGPPPSRPRPPRRPAADPAGPPPPRAPPSISSGRGADAPMDVGLVERTRAPVASASAPRTASHSPPARPERISTQPSLLFIPSVTGTS